MFQGATARKFYDKRQSQRLQAANMKSLIKSNLCSLHILIVIINQILLLTLATNHRQVDCLQLPSLPPRAVVQLSSSNTNNSNNNNNNDTTRQILEDRSGLLVQNSRQQQNPDAESSNSSDLIESLNERLVKESNLDVVESQHVAAVVLPPPSSATNTAESVLNLNLNNNNDNKLANVMNVEEQQARRAKLQPSSFTGGSGNSYMSMSRDGSNRYEFGFDTGRKTNGSSGERRSTPRLMREETRLEDGTVIGRYGYTDPFNVFRIVQYVAGEDGYFATEDVGALVTGADDNQAQPGKANRFQLNKHLHKALEQARAQRNNRQLKPAGARTTRTVPMKTYAAEDKLPSLIGGTPEANRVIRSNDDKNTADEQLSTSGSTSIRYATRINHLVGTNGLSYATAFRPILNAGRMTPMRVAAFGAGNAYEQVRSPSALEAIQQRAQQQQQLLSSSSNEQLRSKLPAPIYKPTSFGHSLFIDHQVAGDSGASASTSQLADEEDQLAYPASHQAPPSAPTWSRPTTPASSMVVQQTVWPRANAVLQASPAWSLLSNNYNTNPTITIIDHTGAANEPLNSNPLSQEVEANFRREAETLKRLQQNRNQQQPNRFNMVYDYNQQPAPHSQVHLGAAHITSPSQPLMNADHWSQRIVEQSQASEEFGGPRFGLALKQFNPPLYLPEVHETKPVGISAAAAAAADAPTAMYSSTIVHSEVAAEQDYKPQRLQPAFSGEVGEMLRSSSSEAAPIRQSAGIKSQSNPSSNDKSGRTTMILDNSTLDLGRSDVNSATATTTRPITAKQRLIDATHIEPLLRYATRLSSAQQLIKSELDLDMENSEQVATYLNQATNATQAGTVSRAKLPDRSKKLSSIFKARTNAATFSSAEADGSGRVNSQVKIRRPVPVNMKQRQFQENELLLNQHPSSTVAEQPIVSATPVTDTRLQLALDDTHYPLKQQQQAGNRSQTAQVPSGKRFGKAEKNVAVNSKSIEQEQETFAPVSAKKRPILREQKPADYLLESTSTTTPKTPLVSMQTNSTSTLAPDSFAYTEPTKVFEHPPVAKIIDATKQTEMTSLVDKALFEKIVKIQEEIAAMTMRTNATNLTTTSTTTGSPEQQTRPPATTTTSSTERPITSTRSPTTTTVAASTSPPKPLISGTTTTNTPKSSTERSNRFDSSEDQSSHNRLDIVAVATDNGANQRENFEQVASEQKLLTGPLVPMDSSLDQGDFLTKLAQDMDTFDSVRAMSPELQLIGSATTVVTTKTNTNKAAAVEVTSTTFAPPAPKKSIKVPEPSVDLANSTITTTSAATSSTTPSSSRQIESNLVASTASLSFGEQKRFTKGKEQAHIEASTSSSLIEPTTVGPAEAQFRPPEEQGASPGQQVRAVPTNTSRPADSSVSSQQQVAVEQLTTSSSLTTAPTVTSTTTTTTTTTTTSAPITHNGSTSTSKPKPTSAPRFGRLVIKRGHKVVARFNSSEPIPDSMIPVDGEGPIIVPDMPRLAMRRSVKRRISGGAAGAHSESPVIIVDNLKSKLVKLGLPSGKELNNTAHLNDLPSPVILAANLTSNQKPPASTGAANSSSSSRQDPMVAAESSGQRFVSFRSLLRGPRSYGTGSSGGARFEQVEDPMLVAESRNQQVMMSGTHLIMPDKQLGTNTSSSSSSSSSSLANHDLANQEDTPRRFSSNRTGNAKKFSNSFKSPRENKKEMASANSTTNNEQVTAPVRLADGLLSGQKLASGRNWSVRLRDSIGREMARPSNKKYDPKEDLKKLVEKITNIERQGVVLSKKRTTNHGNQTISRLETPKTNLAPNVSTSLLMDPSEEANVELFVPLKRLNSTGKVQPTVKDLNEGEIWKTVIQPKQEASELQVLQQQQATSNDNNSTQTTTTTEKAQPVKRTNETAGVLVSLIRFDLNDGAPIEAAEVVQQAMKNESSTNNSTEKISKQRSGADEQLKAVKSSLLIKSPLINVMSNGSDQHHRAAMFGELSQSALGRNSSFLVDKFNLTTLNATRKSQSSSVSFTVTMSPDLEKHWQQLKPVNVSSRQTNNHHLHKGLLVANASSSPHLIKEANNTTTRSIIEEVRVDSRGHIHVRNNQSLTVHVDIEPPRANLPSSSAAPPPVEPHPSAKSEGANGDSTKLTGSAAKRLFSRDTSQVDWLNQEAGAVPLMRYDRPIISSQVAKPDLRIQQQQQQQQSGNLRSLSMELDAENSSQVRQQIIEQPVKPWSSDDLEENRSRMLVL